MEEDMKGWWWWMYTWSNNTDEVSNDGEGTDAETTESGCDGNVSFEVVLKARVPGSDETHSLFLELLGNVLDRRAGDLDPCLGEVSTSGEDEEDVEESVKGISEYLYDSVGRREVVDESADGDHVCATDFSECPFTKESDK